MGIDAEMFARTCEPITEQQVKRLAFEACARFGKSKFLISRPGEFSFWPNGRRALEIVALYEQDGPDIEPAAGETFVRAHLKTRYWGPGYERGDLPFLLAFASWLERKIPACEVWYGGDSSGVCAVRFDHTERSRMLDHLASDQGSDYFERRNPFVPRDERPVCDFCEVEMPSFRYGPYDARGYICQGCDLHVNRAADGTETRAYGGYPDRKCATCGHATDDWDRAGREIDGKYHHLDCWARAELERRDAARAGAMS